MEQAPQFELTTVATNRPVGIPSSLPKVLVLLFQDQNTVDDAREVNQTIRGVHKDSEDLVVASIIDMSGVPRFMRKMAQKMLDKAYEKAANEFPDGYDAAEYIMLLPDWTGKVFKQFKVPDISKRALLIIINHDGEIVLRKQGKNLGRVALKELDNWI